MVKCLELFSGTGSVGKVCKQLGWETLSIDLIMEADHKCDIMDFDYKQYDKDEFDIVWASPPCEKYSALQRCWFGRERNGEIYTKEKNLEEQNEADKLVEKTLEIIDYFKPKYWFIENPQTGDLKNRNIMKNINFYDYDYCKYSDWGYKKTTRIWTNKKDLKPLKCLNDCDNMLITKTQKLHRERIGTSKTIIDEDKIVRCNTKKLREKYKDYENLQKYGLHGTTLEQRYRIPEKIIFDLFLD